jgi:hypothetical protein
MIEEAFVAANIMEKVFVVGVVSLSLSCYGIKTVGEW